MPCSFMIFGALRDQCADARELVEKQLDLGLDAFVEASQRQTENPDWYPDPRGLPIRHHADVSVREWREDGDGPYPMLCKEYATPAGPLRVQVERSEDWPHGNSVPFVGDFLIPRSTRYLIEDPEDLEPLRYLLVEPAKEDVEEFREFAGEAASFARKRGLLLLGGWGVGADMAGWLCGLANLIYMAADRPEMLQSLMDIIAEWNRRRMGLFLNAGVDLFVRRGWYEGTDFWSPELYREFIWPHLKAETELAHERGAKFGYIHTSGTMPLLEMIAEAGVDVLIGVDPVQGQGTDMAAMKEKLAGRVALWGGVNGFLTIERGTKAEVEEAVAEAVRVLAPGGGFILSPVDNVTDTSEATRQNVLALIEAWQRLR